MGRKKNANRNGHRPQLVVVDEVAHVQQKLADESPAIELQTDDPALIAYMAKYRIIFTVMAEAISRTVALTMVATISNDDLTRIAQDATEKLMTEL